MIVHLPLFQTNHTAENIASVNTFKHIKGFFFPMMLHFCAQLFHKVNVSGQGGAAPNM